MKACIRHHRVIPATAGTRLFGLALLVCALPTLPCIVAPAPIHAQQPMGMYSGPTVLRAARLLDVETGEMLRDDVRFVMLGGQVIRHVVGGRDMHSMGR